MIVSNRIVATRRCVKPSTSQASRVKLASADKNIARAYIGSQNVLKYNAFRLRASDDVSFINFSLNLCMQQSPQEYRPIDLTHTF